MDRGWRRQPKYHGQRWYAAESYVGCNSGRCGALFCFKGYLANNESRSRVWQRPKLVQIPRIRSSTLTRQDKTSATFSLLSSTPILAFVCQPQTRRWGNAFQWPTAENPQKVGEWQLKPKKLDWMCWINLRLKRRIWLDCRGGIIWEGRGGWRSGMYSSLTVNVINHKEMIKLWTASIKWSAEREGDLIRQGKLIESLSCSLFIKMIYFAEFHSRFIQVETILSIYLSHCPITKTTTTSNIVSYLIDH